ncbi:MAG: PTS sugar transporter subunit IIA, partial [Candidatus Sumerlaeaceae bacterium]
METILHALEKGRLFELPDNDKSTALQFLAHVLEACPEVPAETDVVGLVQKREQEANTALGKGWACPHARVPYQGDLVCVLGWSPQGIDYGAPDGLPVRLLVMYVIPNDQRSRYLREISLLVRTIQSYPQQDKLIESRDLDAMRNYLLDLIEVSKALPGSEARTRMIRLQARSTPPATVIHDLSNLVVEPVTIATGPDKRVVVLTENL